MERLGDGDGVDWGRLELGKVRLRADRLTSRSGEGVDKLVESNKCSEADFSPIF